jgi:putative transposase
MPNHFHFLVHESAEGGISKFMQKLLIGYTMYFNTKNKRNGPLFAGRFRAKYVSSDRYLKYLYAYIHLNPLLHKLRGKRPDSDLLRKELLSFPYSSIPDYLGGHRPQGKLLTPSAFPLYFEKPEDHLDELFEWVNYAEPDES